MRYATRQGSFLTRKHWTNLKNLAGHHYATGMNTAFSIMTLGIMTLSITISKRQLSKHHVIGRYAECCYAGRRIFIIILIVVMLIVIMPSVGVLHSQRKQFYNINVPLVL
jgi:hypothetical protein